MIYMFLAEGFEEAEAVCPLDILRRAGLQVATVAVGASPITGAHGIKICADITEAELDTDTECEMVVLPGGGHGTEVLAASALVGAFVKEVYERGGIVGAICAAPSVLGRLGLLRGKRATCYPGFEKYFAGGEYTGSPVETDGRIITSRGMGCAQQFGLALVSALCGEKITERVKKEIQC